MNRYIKEYANDIMRENIPAEKKEEIKKILAWRRRDIITTMEAMQFLVKIQQECYWSGGLL